MKLVEMNSAEFSNFYAHSVAELARIKREDFGVDQIVALEKSKAEISHLLPDGVSTKDHFFFSLKSDDLNQAGHLWFGVRETFGQKRVFIFDIFIHQNFRGLGYSKYMLNWLEQKTQELGFNEITLHVLGSNAVARKLYENMGFEITNLYMKKKVGLNGEIPKKTREDSGGAS